nr:hypothetical protein [Streptomyces sp. LUP47B]
MPFVVAREVRFGLACGRGDDGRWRGWFTVEAAAEALWRLGLHPSQPSAVLDGPSPPGSGTPSHVTRPSGPWLNRTPCGRVHGIPIIQQRI